MPNAYYTGVDVSHHQNSNGPIDWNKVKNAGYAFAIIHAGYGARASQKDPFFEENMHGALGAGMHVGAYWFSYAHSVEGARQEAELFLAIMDKYKGRAAFPLCFDWEYDSLESARKALGKAPPPELVSLMAVTFLEMLEAGGWYAMNYTNKDFFNQFFNTPEMKKYDIWLAHYHEEPCMPCGLHQAGIKPSVPGVRGECDYNKAYVDYPRLMSENGLNGWGRP